MIRKMFYLGLLGAIASVAVKSWPDLQRYLKIKQM